MVFKLEPPVRELVRTLAKDPGIQGVVDLRHFRDSNSGTTRPELIAAIAHAMGLSDIKLTVEIDAVDLPEDIAAYVSKPTLFPRKGSYAYRNTRFHMCLSASLSRAPFSTRVYAIAHECAHLVLESIRHPLRESERAVDVTAMVMGFAEYATAGASYSTDSHVGPWRSSTGFVQTGYLTLNEIDEAMTLIRHLRASSGVS
ncbi:hypothetical protein HYT05_02740 [Candidatus Kaiserbacteria bacterium]|nr:hypothetical protein [Candidatus Kaiserbacteria bacterium]